ncbi:hypothetical protein BDN71DRAFT_1510618 [Pleurotus eryngii]|uniref:Uncharacterized protein n=1 Tax=Pleurotus eryngii TaxID=5323 RepID=A0A9P6DDA8_PLEER|nr:hypothetical protein BDN71DRAFT_1510618 [Pleurotus eryngii]
MYHLHDSQPAVAGPRGPSPSARLNSVDSFAFHVSHTQLGATTSRASPNASHAASGCQTTTNRTRFHAYLLRIRPHKYPEQIMILNCAPSASSCAPMHQHRRAVRGWTDGAIDQEPPPNPTTPNPRARPSSLQPADGRSTALGLLDIRVYFVIRTTFARAYDWKLGRGRDTQLALVVLAYRREDGYSF